MTEVDSTRTRDPKAELTLSTEEQETLQRWAHCSETAQRAQILLACAAGNNDGVIAAQLGVERHTVGRWRRRFLGKRLDGLLDEPQPPTGSRLGMIRFKAGYKTAAALARDLGVTKETASAWERGVCRPGSVEVIRNLEKFLRIPLNDLFKHFWGEEIGGSCPCCGGELTLPENPKAKALSVKLPCANKCGRELKYDRHGKGVHRKLCNRCTQLAERIEFTCVGHDGRGTHAPDCPVTILLPPYKIRWRLKDKERLLRKEKELLSTKNLSEKEMERLMRRYGLLRIDLEKGLSKKEIERLMGKYEKCLHFDASTNPGKFLSRQCETVARKAAPLIAYTEADVRKLAGLPERLKFKGQEHRRDLYRKYYLPRISQVSREGRQLSHQRIAEKYKGKPRPLSTKINLIRWWAGPVLPEKIWIALCLFCDKVAIMEGTKAPNFHDQCYDEWRRSTKAGREFSLARLQGRKATLPSRGPGRRPSWKETFSWAVQLLMGTVEELNNGTKRIVFETKSYRTIADKNHTTHSSVIERIRTLMDKLDPGLLSVSFQPAARLLLDAYRGVH